MAVKSSPALNAFNRPFLVRVVGTIVGDRPRGSRMPARYNTRGLRQILLLTLAVATLLCLVAREASAAGGDLDPTFIPGLGAMQTPGQIGVSFTVRDFVIQPDGKIVIAGFFGRIDHVQSLVVRLNPDGTYDNSFSPPAQFFLESANAVALQPDGKILIGGSIGSLNGVRRTGIARLNPDGSVDTSFNSNPGATTSSVNTIGSVNALALQPDGKIVIGGFFSKYNGVSRNGIARVNPDGSLDTTFDPGTGTSVTVSGGANSIHDLALQPDGKILIGGSFTEYNGVSRNRIARVNSNGSLDTTFNPGTGTNNIVNALALQSDGKVLAGGSFTQYNGVDRNRIARINANGSLDTTFNPGTGGNNSVAALALQPDGKVLVGGNFTQYNGVGRNAIARVNTNGSLDTSYNPGTGTDSGVGALLVQSNGQLLVGGGFDQYNSINRHAIARVNTDGSLDTSLSLAVPVGSSVSALALQPDGKILIGGLFSHYGGVSRNNIARLNADGSLDTSFNPGTATNGENRFFGGLIRSITLQPDGRILIGGEFDLYNGVGRHGLARLNPDGSLDTTFDPGTGVGTGAVYSFAVLSDGKILVGGGFAQYNGVSRIGIVRVNANGSLDTTFDASPAAFSAYSIALQPDGKILTSGSSVRRLNSNGSADSTFTSTVDFTNIDFSGAEIKALALQCDGKVLIGGRFDRVNGAVLNNFARLNSDGTLDTSFNPGGGTVGPTYEDDGTVLGVNLQPDGKILITGEFNQYNGVNRNHIARVNSDGSLDATFNPLAGADRRIDTVIRQPDGKLLIGGLFNQYNGVSLNNVARLLADPPAFGFSAANYSVQEDCTSLTITVNRTGDSSGAASVAYSSSNGTANDSRDYITVLGTLQFAAGETSKTFVVLINEDSYSEGNETFNLSLSNAGVNLCGPANTNVIATATVTIIDDASEPATNVIDDPANFVCQHYHDFLNRQPDQSGWDFWTNQITSCNSDASCIEARRINASAAFYVSIEFQQTGYLVERSYKAAYADAVGNSTFGGAHQLPVPVVRFTEFLSDTQKITKGVVVLQQGWEQLLENNKQAFFAEFVQRSRFTNAFPTLMTPAEFVDRLNQNAGNVLSASERTTAINLFSGAGNTTNTTARAQAVRQVAEDQDMQTAEFNRAFVWMQYVGYLRRNPNDPQDTDYTGQDFWLTKLNQFNGDYINAEMVKAFITSIEYRQRFGP